MEEFVVCVFEHTSEGESALRDLAAIGVPDSAVRVVGDLGTPSGEPGAEKHVTLDDLHVPEKHRELLMSTIRDGGVVLAVAAGAGGVQTVAEQNGALQVWFSPTWGRTPSHNAAP